MGVKCLDKAEWGPFKIDDIFDTSKGTYLHGKNIINGSTPYITAKAVDNGLNSFIGNNSLFSGNTITIEKVKLSTFYQPHAYYCSHDVSVLSNSNINKSSGLFLAAMVSRQGFKYSYGRQAQLNVVKRETVFLPIKEGNPDWEYMTNYIDSLTKKKILKYKKYCEGKLQNVEYKNIPSLNEKKWSEFFLKEIFPIVQRGKRLTKAKQILGKQPYISSTALNNGVDNFIANKENVRIFSECLTVANSGSVGATFYHPYGFVASDHVTHLKNNNFSIYKYLFIAGIINRLSNKYNFSREINDRRISRERVILPVNSHGEPDYEYMEQFVKNIEYKKRKKYLDYLDQKKI